MKSAERRSSTLAESAPDISGVSNDPLSSLQQLKWQVAALEMEAGRLRKIDRMQKDVILKLRDNQARCNNDHTVLSGETERLRAELERHRLLLTEAQSERRAR